MTYDNCSNGTDLDPDIEVWVRRIKGLRRYIAKNPHGKAMYQRIPSLYTQKGAPAPRSSNVELVIKLIARQPGTIARARTRRQCRLLGPIGFLLESAHLQASALGHDMIVRRWGCADIDSDGLRYKHLGQAARYIAMANRTRDVANIRNEVMQLVEIDSEATRAKTGKMDEQDLHTLNILRTGSSWTAQNRYWDARKDDKLCDLCRGAIETPDNFWYCPALRDHAKT